MAALVTRDYQTDLTAKADIEGLLQASNRQTETPSEFGGVAARLEARGLSASR